LAEHASGYIVGTWLKFDGDVRAAVDPDRARDFVAAARS
jgi:predicted TIM-barrel enzyme